METSPKVQDWGPAGEEEGHDFLSTNYAAVREATLAKSRAEERRRHVAPEEPTPGRADRSAEREVVAPEEQYVELFQ